MKFGVFSVSMPEYGIEESVRLLKELGYDGVEWRVAEMPEKEPENVPFALRYWACNKSTLELRSIEAEAAKAKALCDEAGLEIFGLTTYLATNELEPLTRVFHAARSIGCRQVRGGPRALQPGQGGRPLPRAVRPHARGPEGHRRAGRRNRRQSPCWRSTWTPSSPAPAPLTVHWRASTPPTSA